MTWETWWLWIAFGVLLLIVEVLAPGFVALGLAIGAFAVGLVLLITGLSLPMALLVWATVSALAWVAIRRLAGERKGQVKIWETDINE